MADTRNQSNSEQKRLFMEQLNRQNRQKVALMADELIRQQQLKERYDALIEQMAAKSTGDYMEFSSEWTPLVWQANENNDTQPVQVNEQNFKVYDMDYMLAQNLQTLQSGQSPQAEYYDWVNTAERIETDMKVDGTTLPELHAKHDFLSMLDDRETEMKRVISLYTGAAFNPNCEQQSEAQNNLKFLVFKLNELRRLRERVQNVKPRPPKHKTSENSRYDDTPPASINEEELNAVDYFASQEKNKSEKEFSLIPHRRPHNPNHERKIKELLRKRALWRERIRQMRGLPSELDYDDEEYRQQPYDPLSPEHWQRLNQMQND
ncbi:MAG: hypothetical protein IJ184_05560 [Alphaproteobacteria bacterium]|nr:hypothetical protein [Alphaproteobacteria bacterium]